MSAIKASRMTEAPRNFTLADFKVEEQIGSGHFGIVYRAVELYSKKTVALKIIFKRYITTDRQLYQLQQEIEVQNRLNHSFICHL